MPKMLPTRYRTLRALVLVAFVALGLCRSGHAQGPPTGTPHSVTLAWVAPSPVGGSGTISGYNVYRSPSGPPAFIKINTIPIVGLTTVDAAVASGTQYTYCATTLDSMNSESVCSIQVTAIVPSNPATPTGLTSTVK